MTDFQTPEWMNDPLVQEIPNQKLHMIQELFAKTGVLTRDTQSGHTQKELLLAMMPLLKEAKEKHMNFTPNEMQAAIAAIRKYSSPEELEQIDRIYQKAGYPPRT